MHGGNFINLLNIIVYVYNKRNLPFVCVCGSHMGIFVSIYWYIEQIISWNFSVSLSLSVCSSHHQLEVWYRKQWHERTIHVIEKYVPTHFLLHCSQFHHIWRQSSIFFIWTFEQRACCSMRFFVILHAIAPRLVSAVKLLQLRQNYF